MRQVDLLPEDFLAKEAYESFSKTIDKILGERYFGIEPFTAWEELPSEVKQAWKQAVNTIITLTKN